MAGRDEFVPYGVACRQRFPGLGELSYLRDGSVKGLFEDHCIAKLNGEVLSLLLPSGDSREVLIWLDRDFAHYSRPILEFKTWVEMGPRRQEEWRARAMRDSLMVSEQLRDIDLYILENKSS